MLDNSKRVVIIDNIKSDSIQQAIFILKDKAQAIEEYNVLDEANRIIYQYINQSGQFFPAIRKKKRKFFGKGEHQA